MNSQINIAIKSFRAIRNADITLNGITVVAGENGCGKSTISKLLYQLYKSSNDYESLVQSSSDDKIYHYFGVLNDIERLISAYTKRRTSYIRDALDDEINLFTALKPRYLPIDFRDKLKKSIGELKKSIRNVETQRLSQLQKRLERYIRSYLIIPDEELNESTYIIYTISLLDYLHECIEKILNDHEYQLRERPISPLVNSIIKECFNTPILPKKLELQEHSSPLIDWELRRLNKSILVKEQIYIDTPMSVGIYVYDNPTFSHWMDLNKLLAKKLQRNINLKKSTLNFIENDVLYGDVERDNDDFGDIEKFTYKRKDGLKVNLLDCATGLKSFAILQLLYKNGTLQKDTLVIIDEPEAHLHPQWVVEYARLIVMLNKEVGTRFFIASHHPDMISAIKYISEKEEVEKNLNFYLAERVDNTYTYDYKSLGLDIDPIFESFNIALDRINQYGS